MNPNADKFLKLIEEMIHLKIQQEMDVTKKATPEIARVLSEKRIADRQRLEQVRMEMAVLFGGAS
jgi:hypothetical protein